MTSYETATRAVDHLPAADPTSPAPAPRHHVDGWTRCLDCGKPWPCPGATTDGHGQLPSPVDTPDDLAEQMREMRQRRLPEPGHMHSTAGAYAAGQRAGYALGYADAHTSSPSPHTDEPTLRARVAAEILDVRRTPSSVKGAAGSAQRDHVHAALADAARRVLAGEHTDDTYPDGWLGRAGASVPQDPR